jgi:hypothetical protein
MDPLQKKLNKVVKLLNEITGDIEQRWPEGYLFCECGETLYAMNGKDGEGSAASRQAFVVMSAGHIVGMDCGAW